MRSIRRGSAGIWLSLLFCTPVIAVERGNLRGRPRRPLRPKARNPTLQGAEAAARADFLR